MLKSLIQKQAEEFDEKFENQEFTNKHGYPEQEDIKSFLLSSNKVILEAVIGEIRKYFDGNPIIDWNGKQRIEDDIIAIIKEAIE